MTGWTLFCFLGALSTVHAVRQRRIVVLTFTVVALFCLLRFPPLSQLFKGILTFAFSFYTLRVYESYYEHESNFLFCWFLVGGSFHRPSAWIRTRSGPGKCFMVLPKIFLDLVILRGIYSIILRCPSCLDQVIAPPWEFTATVKCIAFRTLCFAVVAFSSLNLFGHALQFRK